MISGIGVDIIEIERVARATESERFLKKYFTANEISILHNNPARLAANFAAKEAVSKALGTGFSGFEPVDIEILRNERGTPYVVLLGNAKRTAEALGVKAVLVSLSHSKLYAVAYATALV